MELRLPNIDPKASPEQQLSQLKNYLYQTVEQLNWALSIAEKNTENIAKKVEVATSTKNSANKAVENYDAIKYLIINDADIITSYGNKLEETYKSVYGAQGEFGTYQEYVDTNITTTAQNITQEIDATYGYRLANAEEYIKNEKLYVKTGVLEIDGNGKAIAGLEIGDYGENAKRYARYDNTGTHLYNENGAESVTISEGKTKFSGNVTMDMLSIEGFSLDGNDSGLGLYWEG